MLFSSFTIHFFSKSKTKIRTGTTTMFIDSLQFMWFSFSFFRISSSNISMVFNWKFLTFYGSTSFTHSISFRVHPVYWLLDTPSLSVSHSFPVSLFLFICVRSITDRIAICLNLCVSIGDIFSGVICLTNFLVRLLLYCETCEHFSIYLGFVRIFSL